MSVVTDGISDMAPYPFGSTEVAPVDHRDLGELTREWDRTARLERMQTRRRDRDASEALDLIDLAGWADDHRTDAVESWAGESLLPGHDSHTEPIMMAGVPVDEFCLAELSAALGISQASARARLEQTLELRQRLVRLWAAVHAGKLPAWKARQVAQMTLSLSDEAADHVDRHLAPFAGDLGLGRIKNLIKAAILRFDPETAAADAAQASDGRGVWTDLEHGGAELPTDGSRPNGVGRTEIVASVPDLMAFEDAVQEISGDLHVLGDTSPEQVRRAKAVGIIADSQYRLDLHATAEDPTLAADAMTAEGSSPAEVRTKRASKPNRTTPLGIERPIHVHLHTSTQTARVQASGLPHAASPVSREAIERWIADLAPGVRVKVTPVVDLNRHHAVDQYEAPDHIRSHVDARDDTCVFPFCTNRGRYDLDHIEEHVDLDDGGPPDQTSNRNLAKLCRYHHRAKTHTTWTYQRVDSVFDLDPTGPDPWMPDWLSTQARDPDTGGPPPAYLWTSPIGFTYLVTGTGTYPRD